MSEYCAAAEAELSAIVLRRVVYLVAKFTNCVDEELAVRSKGFMQKGKVKQ